MALEVHDKLLKAMGSNEGMKVPGYHSQERLYEGGNSAGFWWKSICRGREGKNSKNKEQYDRKHKVGHAHILLKGKLSKLARAASLWAGKDWPG